MNIWRFERFFTFWSLLAHFIYFTSNLIPSTFLISCITMFGSFLHNLFLNKRYNIKFDFILHYLPFLLFVILSPQNIISISSIVFTICFISLYLYLNNGPRNVLKYYTNHVHYLKNS